MNYYPYLPFSANPFTSGFSNQMHLSPNPYVMPVESSEDGSRPWMEWEDQRLKMAADKFSGKGWRKICITAFPDGSRTKEECLKRWRQVTKSVSVKGLWTTEEDTKLTSLVGELGAEKWVAIASRLGTRTGKQCRERWHNHLDPRINKAPFTPEEEQLIFQLHSQIGSKWAEMSKHLPGRSDNSIKNFYNTAMQRKRKLQQQTNSPNPAKSDSLKRPNTNKELAFNWPHKHFLPQQTSYPTMARSIHDHFHQLNMRVLTPPDTPQPNNVLDIYNHHQWSQYKPSFLHQSSSNPSGVLNMTPLADSSPSMPQGTFERAVFDQPKHLSSQASTPNTFNQNAFLPSSANSPNTFAYIKQSESELDPAQQQPSSNTNNPPGYHLGLVGVSYSGLTENDVQDYLFMGSH